MTYRNLLHNNIIHSTQLCTIHTCTIIPLPCAVINMSIIKCYRCVLIKFLSTHFCFKKIKINENNNKK